MRSLIKLSFMLISFFMISACFDSGTSKEDRDNADACSAGDTAACDTLDNELDIATEACESGSLDSCARAIALTELIASIPEGLVIASSTSTANAGNDSEFANKQSFVESFLGDTLSSNDFASCLNALPAQPQVQSPLCYGPAINYTDHPDSAGGTEDGQLPTGDLGLWVEDEPGTGQACAAAKLNELVAKAAYNVDLAVGSMTMMACTAALLGESLPSDSSSSLDLSSALSRLPGGNVQVDKAIIKRANLTSGTGYHTDLEATINNQPIVLSVVHDSQNNKGLMQIETTEGGDARGTSVVYELSDTTIKYKMVSSRAQPHGTTPPTVSFTSDGEVSLQSGQDIHVMLAEVSATDGSGSLAYAWNAGGMDDHYRALNVVTSASTGRAYYGYVPSPSGGSESINLDLNNASAGMICNWAGPGNSHTTNNKVQYQELSLSSGDWTATTSKIQYVPTTSCDMAASTGVFTPAFGGPGNDIPYANMNASQQEVVDNGTLDSTAGPSAVNNDLYDQSSINFTLPTAPTAPQ